MLKIIIIIRMRRVRMMIYIRWIVVCRMIFFFFFVIMYHVYICIHVLQRASRKIGSPVESPFYNKVFTYLRDMHAYEVPVNRSTLSVLHRL